MQGTLLHHSAPMEHVKVRVPAILPTPKIGGVPHHALEQRIPLEDSACVIPAGSPEQLGSALGSL